MKYKIQVPGPFDMPIDLAGVYETKGEAEDELREIREDIPDFDGEVVEEVADD